MVNELLRELRGHPFSTYAKFSKKTFLPAHVLVGTRKLEM